MKALSLIQPYALLPFAPRPFTKAYETRGWYTSFGGPLAIHASGRASFIRESLLDLCWQEPFKTALRRLGFEDLGGLLSTLPFGAIVGVVDLVACIGTSGVKGMEIIAKLPSIEERFGDFSEGRFMWELANPRRLAQPVPCRGALNLWDVPADVAAQGEAQIKGGVPA